MNIFTSSRPFLLIDDQSWSFQEVGRIAWHIKAQMEAAGIKANETVAIAPELTFNSICTVLACLLRGTTLFMVSGREPVAKTTKWLRSLGCRNLLSREFIDGLDFSPLGLVPVGIPRGHTVFCSSGSTSAPKAVLHTVAAHQASAQAVCQYLHLYRGRWLLNLPLYHVGGFAIVMRSLLSESSVIVKKSSWQPTHISAVPTQIIELLKTPQGRNYLRRPTVILGGAPIAQVHLQTAKQNGILVIQTYGSTESASQIYVQRGGIGKVLSHAQIKIIDDEINIRSFSLARGYLTAQGIRKIYNTENWYATGDMGSLDEHGLKIKGRADNMIISGGENIHLEEIELAIESCSGVLQAIAVPISNIKFGQRPVAFVRTSHILNADCLRLQLRDKLAHYKIPDFFFPWPAALKNFQLKVSRPWFAQHLAAGSGILEVLSSEVARLK